MQTAAQRAAWAKVWATVKVWAEVKVKDRVKLKAGAAGGCRAGRLSAGLRPERGV